jgi:tetratricopeptide (TPR) repeat protein
MRVRLNVIAALMLCAVRTASTNGPAPQDLVNQARRLDLAGKQDAAVGLYLQALQQNPNSFDAHYGIARALDLAGRYDEARLHFTRAIELAPEDGKDQALRMMGVSYVFTGDVINATRYFRQVFKRRMDTGIVVAAAEVANELGRVYLELGDLENASKWYQTGYETAAREPNRPASEIDLAELRLSHARGRIAAQRGDAREAQRAVSSFKRLLDKGTNVDQQIQYPYLLGYIHFYLKEYDAAALDLQRADQEDPFILALLGETYDKLGMGERARVYYRKALGSSSHAVNNAFARRIVRQRLDGKTTRPSSAGGGLPRQAPLPRAL